MYHIFLIHSSVHRYLGCSHVVPGLPQWGKETACSAGDQGSIPGLGRSPGGGHGNPLQHSCLGNPTNRGAWQATVHRVAKSQTHLNTEHPCRHVVSIVNSTAMNTGVHASFWAIFFSLLSAQPAAMIINKSLTVMPGNKQPETWRHSSDQSCCFYLKNERWKVFLFYNRAAHWRRASVPTCIIYTLALLNKWNALTVWYPHRLPAMSCK